MTGKHFKRDHRISDPLLIHLILINPTHNNLKPRLKLAALRPATLDQTLLLPNVLSSSSPHGSTHLPIPGLNNSLNLTVFRVLSCPTK